MRDLGDRRVGEDITFAITFYSQTGSPKDASDIDAGDIAVYGYDNEDGIGTENKKTDDITFVDHDTDDVEGLFKIVITTTDSDFYKANRDYFVVLTAGEVDNVSLSGVCIATFSLENRVFPFAGIDGAVDAAVLTSSTTVFETDLTETSDDHYNNQALVWGAGAANAGLTFFITDSQGTTANANDKVKLTVQTMPNAPANEDIFVILGTKGS